MVKIIILSGVMVILSFFALIGVIFMYTIEERPVSARTCDKIQRIDGQLYCMAMITNEDDDVMIIEPVTQAAPDAIQGKAIKLQGN